MLLSAARCSTPNKTHKISEVAVGKWGRMGGKGNWMVPHRGRNASNNTYECKENTLVVFLVDAPTGVELFLGYLSLRKKDYFLKTLACQGHICSQLKIRFFGAGRTVFNT